MSIKTFYKPEFESVIKAIFKNGKWFGLNNADKINTDSSFREVLDLTSLDVAELLVELEEMYNVDMEWADTNTVDSINDVYNTFNQSINQMRHKTISVKTK